MTIEREDLATALSRALPSGASCRFVAGAGSAPAESAVLVSGNTAVSVHVNGDGYRMSFWRDGRELAHGWVGEEVVVIGAALCWSAGSDLRRLAVDYPFVEFSELQIAFEQGKAREALWDLASRKEGVYQELASLARRDDVLGALFPRVGHSFGLFADEFSDVATVVVFMVRAGLFKIYGEDGIASEFEGDAAAMVAYLATKLQAGETAPESM